jgi:hypothetical protein
MSPGLCLIAHERAVSATESDKLLSDHARAGHMLTCVGGFRQRWMWTKRGSQATRAVPFGHPPPRPGRGAGRSRAVYAVAFGLDGDALGAADGGAPEPGDGVGVVHGVLRVVGAIHVPAESSRE